MWIQVLSLSGKTENIGQILVQVETTGKYSEKSESLIIEYFGKGKVKGE